MLFPKKPLVIAIESALLFTLCSLAHAEEIQLPEVQVTADKVQPLPAQSNLQLNEASLMRLRTVTNDTARLLDGQPGVSLYGAGGVSSLPVIHGMADDRVRTKVDGMDLISACANHMNPALSYIDPANVSKVEVLAGITPVSVGGDSIAGTIQVESAKPEFAQAGAGTLLKGQLGTFYRSNNRAQGVNASATVAGENVSLRYTGSTARAKNYKAGGVFHAPGVVAGSLTNVYVAGDEVASSQYQTENHALDFGYRQENHLVELKLGLQHIPYQGFPNQRMDMLKNDSQHVNLSYEGLYGWGALKARAYNEDTQHYMNFLEAKTTMMSPLGMPMDTRGRNSGVQVKGDINLSERDALRVGMEYQQYRMSDWWSPVSPLPTMMGGGTFWNINNGQRDRMGMFGEWEAAWSQQWLSQLGLRVENVQMDTGVVQGYNPMMYPAASYAAFNAADRKRSDNNLDLTALARYTPDAHKTVEFGFAQKTRSPSLYERYTWSTNNTMAMNMNNWFGDANGYVGNLNLKPEVARTVSATLNLHDAEPGGFELKLAPYYSYVQNYIDAVSCASVGLVCPPRVDGFLNLSLANQNARLYGADMASRMSLSQGSGYGDFTFNGVVSYVNGKNVTTGDNLYHIMPLNAKLSVEQRLGGWINAVEARLVSAKSTVSTTRNELKTAGFGLLALRASYDTKQFRVDLSVDNLLNKFYQDPLGGAYVGQRPMMAGVAVPGMGRSINAGVTLKF